MARTLMALLIAVVAARVCAAVVRRLRYRPLEPGAVALVTGGGSGVGRELALLCAAAGCRVVLVGRQRGPLEEAAAACVAAGAPQAEVVSADLSTRAGAAAVHAATAAAGLRVKYLILNAGAGAIAPFSADERFDRICHDMMDINYHANVWLLQAYLPELAAQHTPAAPSRVVVLSSLAGVLPSILRSAYTASKHAIQGFMNALRGETDVAITLCCPGYVDTDFHQRVLTADGKPLPGHQRRGISPARCAAACLRGAQHGDAEVIMTLAGKLGYHLRPFFTSVVDYGAKRKSLKSLEQKH